MQCLSTIEIWDLFTRASMVRHNELNEAIMAAIVCIDQSCRYIISNSSSIELCSPYIRSRWRAFVDGEFQLVTLPVVKPKFSNLYYSTDSRIDLHNRF